MEKFSLEVQVLECEVRLHNACGLDSGPQDILLSRDVGGLGYPVQIVQVAGRDTKKRRENKKHQAEKKRAGGEQVGEIVSEKSRSSAQLPVEQTTPSAFSVINHISA